MKLYFNGGEALKERSSEKINRKIFAEAGKNPVVLIFPWTKYQTTSKRNTKREVLKR